MSSVYRGASFVVPSSKSHELGTEAVQAQLADEWPVLSVVLGGSPAAEGKPKSPICSVILRIDNGRLGFCICPEEGPHVAFGVIPDPCKGFDALEAELAAGNYAWRPKRSKRA